MDGLGCLKRLHFGGEISLAWLVTGKQSGSD